jgi:hypothetical protein
MKFAFAAMLVAAVALAEEEPTDAKDDKDYKDDHKICVSEPNEDGTVHFGCSDDEESSGEDSGLDFGDMVLNLFNSTIPDIHFTPITDK